VKNYADSIEVTPTKTSLSTKTTHPTEKIELGPVNLKFTVRKFKVLESWSVCKHCIIIANFYSGWLVLSTYSSLPNLCIETGISQKKKKTLYNYYTRIIGCIECSRHLRLRAHTMNKSQITIPFFFSLSLQLNFNYVKQ
jgi:hypothetical protein